MTWMEYEHSQYERASRCEIPVMVDSIVLGILRGHGPQVKREVIVEHVTELTGIEKKDVSSHIDYVLKRMVRSKQIKPGDGWGFYQIR